MIRFKDKPVTGDRKRWVVSGYVRNGAVVLDRIEGDITDIPGLREAVRKTFDKPRYHRKGI